MKKYILNEQGIPDTPLRMIILFIGSVILAGVIASTLTYTIAKVNGAI